jgi:peroxiredoxin
MGQRIAFAAASLVVVGCLGLWSCGGGSDSAEEATPEQTTPEQTTPEQTPPEQTAREGRLEPGQTFPDVSVYDLEGTETSTDRLTRGHDSLVFFVSLSCDVCEEVMESWREQIDQIPDHLTVFAVTEEEVRFARQFAELHDFPFPLYCDEQGIFATRYLMSVFPSVVAVTGQGRIAFIGRAVTPEFTPRKATGLLARTKKEPEES